MKLALLNKSSQYIDKEMKNTVKQNNVKMYDFRVTSLEKP